MTTITLNQHGFTSIFNVLCNQDIIRIDKDGNLHGKRGISAHPKWSGNWEGNYWSNSEIQLTDKGIKLLSDIAEIKDNEVVKWLI